MRPSYALDLKRKAIRRNEQRDGCIGCNRLHAVLHQMYGRRYSLANYFWNMSLYVLSILGDKVVWLHPAQYATLLTPYEVIALTIAGYGLGKWGGWFLSKVKNTRSFLGLPLRRQLSSNGNRINKAIRRNYQRDGCIGCNKAIRRNEQRGGCIGCNRLQAVLHQMYGRRYSLANYFWNKSLCMYYPYLATKLFDCIRRNTLRYWRPMR